MEGNTKEVLWLNLAALMVSKYGKVNLTQLRKDASIGSSAVSDIKNQSRSVGLDVLDQIAGVFKVKPYELLMPDLGAKLLQWPFRRVSRERLLSLPREDLIYIEGRLEEIIRQLETGSAAAPTQLAIEQAHLDAINRSEPAPVEPPPALAAAKSKRPTSKRPQPK